MVKTQTNVAMKCSIIIPVYNDPFLKECLACIARLISTKGQCEVIVVENGVKTEWIEPLVHEFSFRYLFNAPASSYGARNRGLHEANGEILAFTDSDCCVATDWLLAIERILANPTADGIMGLAEGSATANRVAHYEQQMYEANIKTFTAVDRLKRIDTRNFAMKRRVYERLGDFAPIRFGGDMEYGARAHAAGFRIVFSHAVAITHHNPTALGPLLKKRVQQNIGNMQLLSLHDPAFVAEYFPQLLRYQKSMGSLLHRIVFIMIYTMLRPMSDIILRSLPARVGYPFFKAANVLAIRLGQLHGLWRMQKNTQHTEEL